MVNKIYTLTAPGIRAVVLALNETEAKIALSRHFNWKIHSTEFTVETIEHTNPYSTVISVFHGIPGEVISDPSNSLT